MITSGKGPEECERAVYLTAQKLCTDATHQALHAETVSVIEGRSSTLLLSALVKITGAEPAAFTARWNGTVQWIAQSPFRKNHKRKNWFVGISVCEVPVQIGWKETDVRYESLRASGPGGQHVNKTESAVRAVHIPTGTSVVASDERSQSMNKKAATERLRNKLLHLNLEKQSDEAKRQWKDHSALERGNPVKVFRTSLEV